MMKRTRTPTAIRRQSVRHQRTALIAPIALAGPWLVTLLMVWSAVTPRAVAQDGLRIATSGKLTSIETSYPHGSSKKWRIAFQSGEMLFNCDRDTGEGTRRQTLLVKSTDGENRPPINSPAGVCAARPGGDPATSPLFTSIEGEASASRGVSRGAAWGDVDGDGYPELLVTRPGSQPEERGATLYMNEGGTLVSGGPLPIPQADWEAGSWVDLDADGDIDLALVGRSGAGASFVENRGAAGFASAPDLFEGRVTSATMMCWTDADLDGRLDVFVVGYGDEPNRLFQGTSPWQMEPVRLPDEALVGGASRACAWADLDNDGLPELVVANAREPNLLLRNRGALVLVPDTTTALASDRSYSYGVSAADFDGDGHLDVFVANYDADNVLLRGDGTGGLEPVTHSLESSASKGHAWGDFDLDGRLDLYLGSGTLAPDMRNRVFLGSEGGFTLLADGPWAEHADTSAAVAAADLDADGDLDLFVANWGSSGSVDRLYRNNTQGATWLQVRLVPQAGAESIGARVSVRWTDGSGHPTWSHRWAQVSTGYAGQSDAVVHFGLGVASEVDELIVRWPSGCTTSVEGIPVRQTLTLRADHTGSQACR